MVEVLAALLSTRSAGQTTAAAPTVEAAEEAATTSVPVALVPVPVLPLWSSTSRVKGSKTNW